MIRKATPTDHPAVLELWARSRSAHAETADTLEAVERRLEQRGAPKVTALVGRGDEQAEALWRAAGYKDDVEIGRWVRSLS